MRAVALLPLLFAASPSITIASVVEISHEFLVTHADSLGIDGQLADLVHIDTRPFIAGTHVYFQRPLKAFQSIAR